MIRGMNKEKTSKGMIVGAYGWMIEIAVETNENNKSKEALAIVATRDGAWRRSVIGVERVRRRETKVLLEHCRQN